MRTKKGLDYSYVYLSSVYLSTLLTWAALLLMAPAQGEAEEVEDVDLYRGPQTTVIPSVPPGLSIRLQNVAGSMGTAVEAPDPAPAGTAERAGWEGSARAIAFIVHATPATYLMKGRSGPRPHALLSAGRLFFAIEQFQAFATPADPVPEQGMALSVFAKHLNSERPSHGLRLDLRGRSSGLSFFFNDELRLTLTGRPKRLLEIHWQTD